MIRYQLNWMCSTEHQHIAIIDIPDDNNNSLVIRCNGVTEEYEYNEIFIDYCKILFSKRINNITYNAMEIAKDLHVAVNTIPNYTARLKQYLNDVGFLNDSYQGQLLRLTDIHISVIYSGEIYPQDLIYSDTNGEIISRSITESNYDTNLFHRLFIVSNGGYGKTHFLKVLLINQLSDHTDKQPDYISLSSLLQSAVTSPVSVHCGNDFSTAHNGNSYIIRHLAEKKGSEIECFDLNQHYVFLLDGLNEIIELNNSTNYNAISCIITEIKELSKFDNTDIILTSRKENDLSLINSDGEYKIANLSGVKNACIKTGALELDSDILKLLEKPLFYKYRNKIENAGKSNTKIHSQYQLFRFIHNESVKQACTNMNLMPIDEYLYLYYVILGLIAVYMQTARVKEISRQQVLRLVESVHDSVSTQERYRFIINSIMGDKNNQEQNIKRSQIVFSKAPAFYYDDLNSLGEFIEFTDKKISFIHDDLCEYFAEFYLITYITSISNTELPVLLDMVPNFNMPSSVQNCIKKELGFKVIAGTKSERETALINNENILSGIFPILEPLRLSVSLDELLYSIRQNISAGYCYYQFMDHFRMGSLDNKRYEIISPFTESVLKFKKFFMERPHCISSKEKEALAEILACILQHLRIVKKYRKARHYYEFAEEFLFPDCDEYRKTILRHHRAKIFLLNAQDIFAPNPELPLRSEYSWFDSDEKIQYSDPYNDDSEKCHAKWMFSQGISELEKCIPYNLSGNLLGHIYEKPVHWIEENGLLIRDCAKSYEYYRKTYDGMVSESSLLQMNGTEIIHTARQILFLIYKGYVCFDKSDIARNNTSGFRLNLIQEYSSEGNPLSYKETYVAGETKPYSFRILESITGQDYDLIEWAEGIRKYLILKGQQNQMNLVNKETSTVTADMCKQIFRVFDKNKTEESTQYFINATKYVLYPGTGRGADKRKKYQETAMEKISEWLTKKNTKDDIDSTDPKYLIEDALRIGFEIL